MARVRLLNSLGDTREAVRAGEAALALHPTQETRTAAASAWRHRAGHLRSFENRPKAGTGRTTRVGSLVVPDLPTEEKLLALRAHLRMLSLALEIYRAHVPKKGATTEVDLRLPIVDIEPWGPDFSAQPDEPAVRALLDEVETLKDAIFRFETRYYREHYAACGNDYWWAWMRAIIGLHRDDPERHVQVVREAVETFVNPPGDKGQYVPARLRTFAMWPDRLQYLKPINLPDKAANPARIAHVKLCRELSTHKDPFLRVIGYTGLICMAEDDSASAHALLDGYLRDFPPNDPSKIEEYDTLSFPLWRATLYLSYHEPAAMDAYGPRIVGPWIEKRDPDRIVEWENVLTHWLASLERRGLYDQADAVAARAHEVLVKEKMAGRPENAARVARALETARGKYAEKLGRASAADSAWADYTLRPVPLTPFTFAPFQQIKCLLLDGSKLICVPWAHVNRAPEMTMTVHVTEYGLPEGGKPTLIGKLKFTPKAWDSALVTSAALVGDTVYVGTATGLLAFARGGGEPKIIREADGLPSDEICALAAYDGKLFLGFGAVAGAAGRTAFGCREPDGSFRLLASTTATEARSALDGLPSYWIKAIVPDPERKCLWLAVDGSSEKRNGVWRFSPATGQFELILPERWGACQLGWSGKSLLYQVSPSGLMGVDPGNLSRTWLLAGALNFPPTGCSGPPLYGCPQVGLWPASLDGNRVITGGSGRFGFHGLNLHRKGSPPAALKKGPDGERLISMEHFLETPSGLLVVTGMGRAYLITRKGSPNEKRPSEAVPGTAEPAPAPGVPARR